LFGARCLVELIRKDPKTVLDVGSGKSEHTKSLLAHGAKVVGIDMQPARLRHPNYSHVQGNFLVLSTFDQYDAVWTSHTLEHVPDPGVFLRKCRTVTKLGGWFGIVVPSDRNDILIDSHCTFWTPAHLLYNMVLAGWNCKDAEYYTEGRDIGLLVSRMDVPTKAFTYATGQLGALQDYFPVPLIPRVTNPWLPDRWPPNYEDF